jgi:hypothetical protein
MQGWMVIKTGGIRGDKREGKRRGRREEHEGMGIRGKKKMYDVNLAMAVHLYYAEFATTLIGLEKQIRQKVSEIFTKPASALFFLPEMSKIFLKKENEKEEEYVGRLQKYIENQAKD